MIEKRTVLSRIDIDPQSGIVMARFVKQIVEDGKVLHEEYHRTSIEPGADTDKQMALVNAHLQTMNSAPVQDYALLKAHCALAHTPQVIAAHKAREKKE